MTDLSFWNQAITRGQPVIDSQNGELIKIEVKPGTAERIEVLGRKVEARALHHGGNQGAIGHRLVRCRRATWSRPSS